MYYLCFDIEQQEQELGSLSNTRKVLVFRLKYLPFCYTPPALFIFITVQSGPTKKPGQSVLKRWFD